MTMFGKVCKKGGHCECCLVLVHRAANADQVEHVRVFSCALCGLRVALFESDVLVGVCMRAACSSSGKVLALWFESCLLNAGGVCLIWLAVAGHRRLGHRCKILW